MMAIAAALVSVSCGSLAIVENKPGKDMLREHRKSVSVLPDSTAVEGYPEILRCFTKDDVKRAWGEPASVQKSNTNGKMEFWTYPSKCAYVYFKEGYVRSVYPMDTPLKP